ncbi:MAG: NUDIX hydrolase [Candidatus Adlerbacteria bacterium]|nr:NUDIX hydrolase [Candidatus Adlerbacteria bacterium]
MSGLVDTNDNGWPRETIVDVLVREIAEECGVPNFEPVTIYGTGGQTAYTTGKGDKYVCVEPFCFVQSMGPPQPWLGPVFLVEVTSDFEPDRSKSDGEAGEHRWWSPEELLDETKKNPGNLQGLHIGPLEKLCVAAIAGKI